MSTISPEQVKQWVRDEIKRILEAGLMYTEGCNPNSAVTSSPASTKVTVTNRGESPTAQKTLTAASNSQSQEEDLDYSNENGKLIIKPKHHLTTQRFIEVTNHVKNDGGRYVNATSDTPGHWEVPHA